MAWPTDDITTTQLDGTGDDPSQARPQLYTIGLRVKDVIAGRNTANGIAPLDGSSLVPLANIPATLDAKTFSAGVVHGSATGGNLGAGKSNSYGDYYVNSRRLGAFCNNLTTISSGVTTQDFTLRNAYCHYLVFDGFGDATNPMTISIQAGYNAIVTTAIYAYNVQQQSGATISSYASADAQTSIPIGAVAAGSGYGYAGSIEVTGLGVTNVGIRWNFTEFDSTTKAIIRNFIGCGYLFSGTRINRIRFISSVTNGLVFSFADSYWDVAGGAATL